MCLAQLTTRKGEQLHGIVVHMHLVHVEITMTTRFQVSNFRHQNTECTMEAPQQNENKLESIERKETDNEGDNVKGDE